MNELVSEPLWNKFAMARYTNRMFCVSTDAKAERL